MNNSIYPCLVLKGKVAEAADFYLDVFGEGKVVHTSPFVILLALSGQNLMLLNDGPSSLPNPAISFMVISESPEETEAYWNKLIVKGKALMPLDSYDWSSKYGWVADQYGVSWQLYTGGRNSGNQKFCPTLMFTGTGAGKAAEAIQFYTSLFPQSTLEGIMKYAEEDGDITGFVKHGQFKINNFTIMAMDSSAAHGFSFNEAVSLVVNCDTQAEIDMYWEQLSANGGKEVACGWLTDRYGISWQVVPGELGKLLTDPEKGERAIQALMKMKKLVIADLENARPCILSLYFADYQ
ncbi:VOC family protein [Pedobacter sp. L105]|uniref:VOC family protein n=1 Tax=Pedobacter sp. L105 TaxID=1641871 RepID=UPI00131C5477|nr:VOC family protein [Pedobacter sp. L105]